MADDLPMEAMDDEMPELVDIDLPAQLPSLIQQNSSKKGGEETEFTVVSRRKRKNAAPAEVDMVDMSGAAPTIEESTVEGDGGDDGKNAEMADDDDAPRPAKRSKGQKGELRKVPVPKHRYTPLKENWPQIFTPVVKNLGLQIRFNLKSRNVEIRNPADKEDTTDLQKAHDFVKAFIVGFDVNDALALIRLDHLFLETFEVADVRQTLKGDNLSRAVGRIAGKDGRTKLVIENVTKTRIVLADTKIHLLGAFNNLKVARNAICSLILGAPPSKVYGNLRNLASRASERL